MTEQCLVVGDIGGTNARFALANRAHPGVREIVELKCADFETSDDAIRHFLDQVGAPGPAAMCLAAAGPVVDGSINVTNNHWQISSSALASQFDVSVVRLLNDFEAIAYSLPYIGAEERLVIGSTHGTGLAGRSFNVAVIGPGTGLGKAGLCGRDGALVAVTGEGGHVGFAPETALQSQILDVMRRRFDRVSAERLVAGSGIENIYNALVEIRGNGVPDLSAPDIFAATESSNTAMEAVDVFFEMMGQVAGDLALTLGAWDGVFIAGGIAKRYPDMLERSRFREAFERKGRYESILRRVPTWLIMHEQPGLLGAAYVAQELVAAAD